MNALRHWLRSHASSLQCVHGQPDHVRFLARGVRSTVTINHAQSYKRKLAAVLHECGHVIIYQRRRRNCKTRICGATYKEWWQGTGGLKRGTKRRMLNTLYEEMLAWELGEKLARKLKIRFCSKTFNQCRTKALITYTTWVKARSWWLRYSWFSFSLLCVKSWTLHMLMLCTHKGMQRVSL